MFRKKQTPETPRQRTVRPQQSANVFSYYANRSSTETPSGRRMEVETKKKGSSLKWLVHLPSIMAGLVLVGSLVYVSTLKPDPKLQILGSGTSKSLISGTDYYEDEIQKILESSVFNRSKLLIDTNKLAAELRQKFPELGEITVVLPLVNRRPIIEVSPAEPSLVLSTLEGVFVIDENGRAIADAHDVESSIKDDLPVVQDESGLPIKRGQTALPKETVSFIETVAGQLEAKRIAVQTIVLPPIANELHIRLSGQPYFVKFDVRGEGRLQAGSLIAVKEKLEADKRTPKEYIDVRVPDKAFYK